MALGIAAGAVRHPDGMPLGVHQQRLLTRERAPDRPAEEVRCQCRLGLVGHVLLAAEGTAVADKLDGHQVAGDSEHRGDLVPVVPNALSAGPDVQAPTFNGCCHRGFRFDEGVFDSLGLEDLGNDMCGPCQSRLNLTARVAGHGQDVPVKTPHGIVARYRRQDRVTEDLQGAVVDSHQLGRPTGCLPVVGYDHGEDVTEVRGAASLGDEHRPVGVDDADAQVTGNVGGCEDGMDPVDCLCCRGVDPDHIGAGMVGEVECSVQQTVRIHVVDERPVAQGQFGGLILRPAGTDTTDPDRDRNITGGNRLHGIQDLHVAGAPAEVSTEVAGCLVPREGIALPVYECLGPHHDPGGAEPALEGAVRCEGVREAVPLGRFETLEGCDGGTLGLFHGRLAGHPCLSVEQHRAAAALARGRTAVLGRGDPELVAQGSQKVRVAGTRLDGGPVQDEGGHLSLVPSSPSRADVTLSGTSTPACPVMRP